MVQGRIIKVHKTGNEGSGPSILPLTHTPRLGVGIDTEAGGKTTVLFFVERALVLKHIFELYFYGQTQ